MVKLRFSLRSIATVFAFLLGLGLLLWRINSPFSGNQQEFSDRCARLDGLCQRITHARMLGDDKIRALPFASSSHKRSEIKVEIQIHVPKDGFDGGVGLCIPRSAFLKDLQVDGQPIRYTDQPSRNYFLRPLFTRILPELTPGGHILNLHLVAPDGFDAGLSGAWVGSAPEVSAHCQMLREHLRDRSHNITWVMAAIGLFSFLLWYRLRDTLTLTFSALSLTWVLHLWVVTTSSQDAFTPWWSSAFFGTRILFVLPMIWYVLRLSGRQSIVWLSILYLFFFTAGAALLLVPADDYRHWLVAVSTVSISLCAYLIFTLLTDLSKKPSFSLFLTVLCFTFVVVTNIYDFSQWFDTGGYGSLALSYLSVPVLCLVCGYQLLISLIKSAEEKSNLAAQFKAEVAIQKQQIESDVEKIQQQREQLAVFQERKRLVRDMHDGLGSRLMAISARLKNPTSLSPPEIEGLLDDSIQELRSVLDILSLEPHHVDDDDPISSLLGTLRWRMAPAMEAKGINLNWSCDPLPQNFLLRDDQRLNLIRFWQEAFTNVLKHSCATTATFEVTQSDRVISMVLSDNGIGFSEIQGHGIGYKSMNARAEAIGANFELSSIPQAGTTLRLTWQQEALPEEGFAGAS